MALLPRQAPCPARPGPSPPMLLTRHSRVALPRPRCPRCPRHDTRLWRWMAWPSPGPPNGPCTDALLCYARPAACVTGTLFSYLNFIYRYLSGAVHKLRHTIGGGGGGAAERDQPMPNAWEGYVSVSRMTIRREGGQKCPKEREVICERPLTVRCTV